MINSIDVQVINKVLEHMNYQIRNQVLGEGIHGARGHVYKKVRSEVSEQISEQVGKHVRFQIYKQILKVSNEFY
jgi:hypothetical protein